MQEPAKTIKELLETEWTLDAPAKKQIAFRIDEPINLETRFVSKDISIEVRSITAPAQPRNRARTIFREIIAINIWVQVKPRTEAGKRTTIDNKRLMIDHIKTIIDANKDTATDVAFIYFGGDRAANGLSENPPYVRSIINVVCLYWHTSA